MASNEKKKTEESFMIKVSSFIVDKRNLLFFIFGLLIVFSAFSRNWVNVENSLSAYLPATSETREGLDIMEQEFVTFGTCQLMIANISYEDAEKVSQELKEMKGIQGVTFDDSLSHYNKSSALIDVTIDYPEADDRCLDVLDEIKEKYKQLDLYVSTSLGDQQSEIIASEMQVIIVLVAIVVLLVLFFTSETYAEIPVLILTFLSSAIINMGFNFILGTISFVSDSVTICLQLALSVDYAVILCNRYKEEHLTHDIHDAAVIALSKAIPEICSSSLTTIGGLAAMLFMQFGIGADMGINLIKAILFSLMSVFFFMPGLLVLFGPIMDKTRHKSFIPKISFVGKFAYFTRFVMPVAFLGIIVGAFIFSKKCPYVYGYETLKTPKLNSTQITANMINDTFGRNNFVALVVPAGDYGKERKILDELEKYSEVDHTQGLSNTEALGGYMLTDKLTPRQFAELTDVDYELIELVYAVYAAQDENYGKIVSGLSTYAVPLIDMFMFVYEEVDEGYVTLDAEIMDKLTEAYTAMTNGKLQLQGKNYSRMLVYLNLPEDGDEVFEFIDTIRATAQEFYPDGKVLVVGNATSAYDFKKSFAQDNTVVSVVSIVIVLAVLLFTFKSVGMPVLLIMVIQGAIWVNFSFPYVTGNNLFFMSYLVVSSIQMGANVDYAIVISGRFMELKNKMPKKDAMIETLNFAFPTIITSGSMLALAGILIGQMTSEASIVGIGQSLGRGTIISIILVMFCLPQILLLGEKIIDMSSFNVKKPIKHLNSVGLVRLDGVIAGEINGQVRGIIHAYVDGDVNVNLISGTGVEEEKERLEKEGPAGLLSEKTEQSPLTPEVAVAMAETEGNDTGNSVTEAKQSGKKRLGLFGRGKKGKDGGKDA